MWLWTKFITLQGFRFSFRNYEMVQPPTETPKGALFNQRSLRSAMPCPESEAGLCPLSQWERPSASRQESILVELTVAQKPRGG